MSSARTTLTISSADVVGCEDKLGKSLLPQVFTYMAHALQLVARLRNAIGHEKFRVIQNGQPRPGAVQLALSLKPLQPETKDRKAI